jgi:hypothetical protein
MNYVLDDVYYNTNIFYENTSKIVCINICINTNDFTIIEELVIIVSIELNFLFLNVDSVITPILIIPALY